MKFRGEEIQEPESKWINEPGIYSVYIFDSKYDEFKNKDGILRKCVSFIFKDDLGRTIRSEKYYLHPEALWKLEQLALICGFDEDADLDVQDFISKPVVINVIKSSYTKDGQQKTIHIVSSIESHRELEKDIDPQAPSEEMAPDGDPF